jgi:hypothetical protein
MRKLYSLALVLLVALGAKGSNSPSSHVLWLTGLSTLQMIRKGGCNG